MSSRTGKKSIFLPSKDSRLDTLLKKRPDLRKLREEKSVVVGLALSLIELRASAGLSQGEVARKAGIGIATYQRIEQGQPTANPTLDVLSKLAGVFKVKVADLLQERSLKEVFENI